MKKQFTNKARYLGLKLTVMLFALLLISGQSWGATQTITINLSSAGGSSNIGNNSYNSGAERTWSQSSVSFGGKAITAAAAPNVGAIQAQANNGVIYNTTALPGRIVSIVITSWTGTTNQASTLSVGSTSRLVNTTTGNYSVTGTSLGTSTPGSWTTVDGTGYTFFAIKRGGTAAYWSQIVITYEVTPTITAPSQTSLNGFTTTTGTASASQTFTVGGSNLTADLAVNAPTDYEVRENGNGIFGSSVSFVPSSGTVATKTIEVRIAASAGTGAPSGNVVCSSTNATSQNVAVSGNVSSASAPLITVTGTISAFANTNINTTSAEQNYTVEGSNLTADISIAPPTGFEISTGTGGSFSATNPVVLTQSGGTVNQTTIYVRFAPTAVQAYSGNITHTSTGATQIDKALSGTGIKAEPTNHSTNFLVATGTPSYSTIDVIWDNAIGGTIPEGYVVKASSVSYAAITDPIDGTPETSGTLVKIVALTQTATFTGLSGGTTYYFKIFPFTNSGSSINYKTNATVPTSEATTTQAPGGSVDNPLTCSEAIALNNPTQVKWVKGYIRGFASSNTVVDYDGTYVNNQNTNIAIADNSTETNVANMLFVQLNSGVFRDNLNLYNNTSNYNKEIILKGSLEVYFTPHQGLKNMTEYKWVSQPSTSSTGNWNSSIVWSSGIPYTNDNVTISGDVTINSTAVCKDLTISNGAKITINPGLTLTVTGTLTNNGGTSGIVIKSDATGTGSLINSTTGVNATAERYLTGNVFHQLGLPISNIAAGTSAGQTGSVFQYCTLDSYNEATNNYVSLGSSDIITSDKGYVVKYTYGASAPAFRTLSFAGTLNTGTINIPMTKTADGYNLIPNPYPSSIDWNAANGWTKNSTNNTTYIYNHPKSQWDLYDGSTGTNDGVRYIAPGQSFFVQASSAGNLIMTNSVRLHNATSYVKSTNSVIDNLIKIKVSGNANSITDEAVVYFANNPASSGSEKWFSYEATAPSLYTVKNNGNYAINVLSDANTTIAVPMAFKAGANGNYTLKATEIGNFTLCSGVTLEDLMTGSTQNILTNTVYNFTATTTDNVNRFVLHFATSVGVNEIGKTNGGIYAYDNNIYVNANEQVKQIAVYNTLGQLVKTVNNVNGLQKINMNGNATGYYIVKVICDKNVYSEKVLVK